MIFDYREIVICKKYVRVQCLSVDRAPRVKERVLLPNLLVNMTRKKHCVFQRLVVLGKMVHTPSFGAFEFLRAYYHGRYVSEEMSDQYK